MVEYTTLFLGPGVPKAPPCESFYRTSERIFFGSTSFEMKAALNAHGLESKRKYRQPEDHIGLELMFLSVLSNKLLGLGIRQASRGDERAGCFYRSPFAFVDS